MSHNQITEQTPAGKGTVLIPTNGVQISKTQYPKGFYVARYDAQGFTSSARWFSTAAKAEAYAATL